MAESIFITRQGNLLVALRAEHDENARWNVIERPGYAAFREADFRVEFLPLMTEQGEIGGFQFLTGDEVCDRQISAAYRDCIGYVAQKRRHHFVLGNDEDVNPSGKKTSARYWINANGEVLMEIGHLRPDFAQPIDFTTVSMSESALKYTGAPSSAVSARGTSHPRTRISLWKRLFRRKR